MDIDEILQEILEESKLNRREFSKKLGIKVGHLANWLNGVSKPSYDHLRNICETLGIEGDRILGIGKYKE